MRRNVKRLYQVLNIAAVAATIVVNILSVSIPFFGNTQAEVSARHPNLFVPAGFTFSIWGVIWVLLAVFAAWQARDLLRREELPMPFLERIGPWFAVATLGNLGWLVVFQAGLVPLSMLPILLLFAGLLAVYLRLGTGREGASTGDRLAVLLPFSVYLGWVSIAVIANASAALVALGWRGEPLPEAFWAVLMVAAGAALALLRLVRSGDLFFALAVVWAFVGIAAARSAAGDAPAVTAAAVACGAIVLLAAAWLVPSRGLYRSRLHAGGR